MNNVLELTAGAILDDSYEGQINLPSWTGFQNRQGPYGSKNLNAASNSEIKVFVSGRLVDSVKVSTQEQINAIEFLHQNDIVIRDAILDALFKELPEIKEVYEDLMPEITAITDFKNVLGLSAIHILDSNKEGFAYVGYEFGCEWDEEHGVGIMMYKEKVIDIGQADTSFNPWVTYQDNGTLEKEVEQLKTNNDYSGQIKNLQIKKPWWKFW